MKSFKAISTSKAQQISLLLISLLFYVFFFFLDGYVMCVDSNSYIHMYFFREPLYPLYLSILRTLLSQFGHLYLHIAVLGQSLLAAYAAYSIASFVQKECHLPHWISYILLSFSLLTSLLCRFAAKRGSMYSNSILSEGITISLYLLFIRFCFEYLIHQSKKSFIACVTLCFLGISTRKQMVVLLFLFMLSILYTNWKKTKIKSILLALFTFLFTITTVITIDHGYNYFIRGQFEGHVDDNRFISTIVFYTADRSFEKYIENEEVQKVFLDIYDICEGNGYLMNQAPKNWYEACDHFAEHYDLIQINTMLKYLRTEVPNLQYAKDVPSIEVRMDMIKAEINHALLPHEIPRIITIVKNNFLDGLVNTVAKRTPLLCLYSIIVFVAYIAIYISLFILGNKKGFTNSCRSTIIFSTLVIISIIMNNLLVSAVIFAQTRYVIYNMPLFYISFFIMLLKLFNYIKSD